MPQSHQMIYRNLRPGVVLNDAAPAEEQPAVGIESEEIKKELERIKFPQVEGDLSPGAIVPQACQALQRFTAKLDAMFAEFKKLPSMTPLQTRTFVALAGHLSICFFFLREDSCTSKCPPLCLRMKSKLELLVGELSHFDERLADLHAQGVLEGFSYSLLALSCG